MSAARPLIECGIEELETTAADPAQVDDVRRELAFRRGTKRPRALAKMLGCSCKVSPTNRSQVGAAADTAFPVASVDPEIVAAFSIPDEVLL